MQEIQEIDESQLRPIFDPATTRQSIMDRTKSAFETKFPLENDKVRLELANVGYKGKTQFGIHDTKKALMEGRRLSVPLHGDVRLIDKKSGETLDERKGHLLANVPYMTDRGTFINKGTEYIVVNQSRLRPGIYTRRKDNGELEAHINVKSGTGSGMRMFMEPETGVYRVKVGDSQIKLMPILQRLGVGDDELKSVWGPEVFEANRIAADDQAFEKFYDRLVGARGAAYLRRLREDNAAGANKTASLSEQDEAWYSALTDAIAKEAETEIAVEDTLRDMGWQANPETGHYSLIAKAAQIVWIPWDPELDDKKVASAAAAGVAGAVAGGILGGAGSLVVSAIQSLRIGELVSGKKVPKEKREDVKWMRNLAIGTGLGALGGGALGAYAGRERSVSDLTKSTRTQADLDRNREILADPLIKGDTVNVPPASPPSADKAKAFSEGFEMKGDPVMFEHLGDYKPSQFKGNYGDNLGQEVDKARRYGKSVGLGFDYDRLHEPVPVYRFKDSVREDVAGQVGSYASTSHVTTKPVGGLTGWIIDQTPDKLREKGWVELPDGRFIDPAQQDSEIVLDSTGKNPLERFAPIREGMIDNLTTDEGNSMLPMDFEESQSGPSVGYIPGEMVLNTPEETLDHELTHAWTSPYLARANEKSLNNQGGLLQADEYGHASDPNELVGWASRLQHAQYGIDGKRLETPDEARGLIEGIIDIPDTGDFEEKLNVYPHDVRRLFRHLRRMQGDSNVAPDELKKLKDMLYKVTPALVHTFAPEFPGQPGMKMASVEEGDILLWGDDPMVGMMEAVQKFAAVVVPAKKNDFSVAVKLLEEARSRVDTNPTQKRKETGNYRMGHVRWNGLDITIENPVGSVRSGTDRHGKRWATTMKTDYGYVKGTRGKDGDHIDVFLGPNLASEMVFVVDQDNNGDGTFDEHKCVVGCLNQAEAKDLYLSNYQKSWKGFSAITPLTVDEFKWWCFNGDTSKPMSEQHTPKFAADYQGWIGFDLDGTLAYSEDGDFSKDHIGEPIEDMLELAKGLVASGARVKIFTARAASRENIPPIEKWLEKHGLGGIEITNEKDPGMRTLFDDRVIRVAKNEGLSVPISDELQDYLTNTEKKGTFTGPVEQLKQLKAFSDKRRYAEKNALARKLISAAQDEYFIDSSDDRGIVGVTHRPSGFRFHMPLDQLDPSFRKTASQKEAVVKFEDGKWKLYTKDGTKVLGTHLTADAAHKQEYAIQKSQEGRLKKKASGMLKAPLPAKPEYSYTPTAGAVGGVQLTKLQARLGDEKVGEVFIRQQPGLSHDRITNLFVSEKYRGNGLARSLMERAIGDYGKERELQLKASPGFSQGPAPDQNDLIGFYKTLGFATFDDQGNMKRPAPNPISIANLGGISSKLGVGTNKAASLLQAPGKTASGREFDIASLASEVMAAITMKTASEDAKQDVEEKLTPEDRVELVRMQLERMEIDPEISRRNLGGDFGNVGPSALLETSRKLLMINRGEAGPDDRDSKANQTFHSVDDFLEERVLKDAGKVGRTLLGRAGWQGSLKSLKIGHFTPQLDGLIVSNSLSQATPGINPIELMDIHQKITQMGDGGIPSMDAVPMDARNVHISQIGVIDPIRTPESGGVGIDQRLGSYARKGPNQQLYMPLIDRRTGKRVWRTPSQVYGKTLLFPRRVPMNPGNQQGV